MSKFSIIFLSQLLFTTAAWAIEQNNSTQTITSAPYIYSLNQVEHTNLKTENYVWQIELMIDTQNKSISHKLLNPNAKFPMLDRRALELAQNYSAEELEKLSNIPAIEEQTQNTIHRTAQPTKSYILHVKFPLGVAWKKQPRFQRLAEISAKFCKLRADDPFYEQAIIRKDRDYTFKAKLHINHDGVVNSVKLLNPSSNISLNNLVYEELKSSQFQPYNENGIPIEFEAEQPIKLVCPHS